MGIRRLARQRALQLLYSLEYGDQPFEAAEGEFLSVNARERRKGWGPFPQQLARITFEHRQELDPEIAGALQNWTIDRLPRLDHLCMRMALCEFRFFPEIPLKTTINEYVELAKLFGTEDSPPYVNAVLDRLAQNYKHKDFELKESNGAAKKEVKPAAEKQP